MDHFIALVAHNRSDMPFEPKHREKLQRLARNEGSCCKEGRSAAMAQGGPLRGHGKEGRSAAMGPWQGRSAAVTGEAAPRPADSTYPRTALFSNLASFCRVSIYYLSIYPSS